MRQCGFTACCVRLCISEAFTMLKTISICSNRHFQILFLIYFIACMVPFSIWYVNIGYCSDVKWNEKSHSNCRWYTMVNMNVHVHGCACKRACVSYWLLLDRHNPIKMQPNVTDRQTNKQTNAHTHFMSCKPMHSGVLIGVYAQCSMLNAHCFLFILLLLSVCVFSLIGWFSYKKYTTRQHICAL